MADGEILTATERSARVVYKMMMGWTPTTREVTEACRYEDDSGAWYLMCRISLEVPVYLDDDHRWRIVTNGENQHRHYVTSCD